MAGGLATPGGLRHGAADPTDPAERGAHRMQARNILTASALVAALAGCNALETGEGGAEGAGAGMAASAAGDDACGAADLQGIVGTSVGELQAASLPENRRIIFPGMAVTMDFQPERVNVEIGSDDRIARVFCG
jgi:hypothetical protein